MGPLEPGVEGAVTIGTNLKLSHCDGRRSGLRLGLESLLAESGGAASGLRPASYLHMNPPMGTFRMRTDAKRAYYTRSLLRGACGVSFL